MYQNVCTRYQCDPLVGVSWNTTKCIFLQANNKNSTTMLHTQQQKEQQQQHKEAQNDNIKCNNKRLSIASISNISCSDSMHSIATNDHIMTDTDSQCSNSHLSNIKIYRRKSIKMNASSISFDADNDASTMIVDMLESKNKNLSCQLIKERAKRKKTEEIAQSLLTQNDEYKQQIVQIQQENVKINHELSIQRLNNQEKAKTIAHLQQQRNTFKNERDESLVLLTRIEQEHSNKIKKIKIRHKSDIDHLQQTVDTLNKSLARKQQSLVEALQAVDENESMRRLDDKLYKKEKDEKLFHENIEKPQKNNRIRTKLKAWNQRRKSTAMPKVSIGGRLKPHLTERRSNSFVHTGKNGFVNLRKEIPVISKTVYLKRMSKNWMDDLNDDSMQLLSEKMSETLEESPSLSRLDKMDCMMHTQMDQMKSQMDKLQTARNSMLSSEEFIGY